MGALDVVDDVSLKIDMNADIDSLGGTVENEVVNEIKIASRDADLENVQEELRKQLIHRELAQRELEFLENGGDPLDFRFGLTSSVSVQSTSLTGQHREQIVTSKAKSDMPVFGTHVHSDELTPQQRKVVCDADTVASTLPFEGKNQSADVENNSINLNIIASSELSSRVEGTYDGKESEESTIFRLYARKNRSKPNHDLSRSALTDVLPSRDSVHVPVPSRFGLRDSRSSLFDSNLIDQKIPSNSVEKSTRSDPDKIHKVIDVSNFDFRPSSNLETLAGLPKCSSDEESLHILTSVVPQAHFVDVDKSSSDKSTEIIVGKADFLINGCLHSENANRNNEVNTVVAETESPCVQANSQDEADKGMIKDDNYCDQIVFDGEKSGIQNNFENNFELRGVPETSEMDKEFQAGARTSTVSSGTELNNPITSGIYSLHRNISVSDSTIEIGGSANAEPIVHETSSPNSFSKSSADAVEPETGDAKELQKVDEDAILAEALLIEAKRKRISQLLMRTPQSEKHPKSHWHYVLEEMAWLANDFMQERLWKISAAAQFGRLAASASCQRVEKKMPTIELIAVAQPHARAVLKFWQSVESSVNNEDRKMSVCDKSLLHFNPSDAVQDQTEESKVVQELKSEVEQHRLFKNHAIREYAIRFLKHNASVIPDLGADSQLGHGFKCSLFTKEEGSILESNLIDETLFYEIPAGAMENYRNAIESQVLQIEVSGGGLHEAERSLYGTTEEHMLSEEDDEHDTCYFPSAFEGSQASKTAQKKRKNLSNAYASGMYDVGADLTFGRHHSDFYARPIPKKRIRTASHQRQSSDRTYSSSEEDTDSFQDDQIEYPMKMEKHLLLDVEADLSKSKKNKYPKPLKQRWQQKTPLPNEQRDICQKKINSQQQLRCIGVSGTIGQPNAKRSKTPKQTVEGSFESPGFIKGTVPSDMASRMKNMPHPSQIMRMIGVSNHGRKAKSLKGSSMKSSSGHFWSSFEDQALVVLVHDLGLNWNLVSDAMNSALQFVYIFRKPDECMERHKILMDKNTDDGADSAEDSVSSKPYPSTLPGIPKGSARQLFQRLQGPMEEETLKSHFEKIMFTKRKQNNRKIRSDVHDCKQVIPNHNSHVTALSEVSLNYLNGGYLTPLDLCDLPSSNLDSVTIGLQDIQSVRPPSSDNSSCQGTSGLVTGSNSPHAMGTLSASFRDGMYETSRPSPSINTEQKSNLMSTQQSSPSVSRTPSVMDRNTVHMVPGANSMGTMGGLNCQNPPISRLGFQGTNLSPSPIAGGMSSSGMIGIPNHIDSRVNSSQGTSTSNFSGTCTTLNQESQRQTTAPELHTCAAQGNNHGTTPSSETIPTFSCHNPTTVALQHQMPPHQSHGLNHHPRIRGPSVLQHPAYARLIKEQQLQQQLVIQQQSSALIPTRPISQSPMLPQITPLAPVLLPHSPVTLTTQPHQKHHLPPQGRPASHPFQQSGRPSHPHKPQIAQPQQLAKFANGAVTGNISTSQNETDNSLHINRISSSVGLSADLLASVHAGPAQSFRPQAPQSFGHTFQQKRFHGSVPPTNPVQQTPHNSDNGSQKEKLPKSSTHRSSSLHSAKSDEAAGRIPRLNSKSKALQKKGNKSLKDAEKELQQNHLGNTDQQSKDPTDHDRPREQIKRGIPFNDIPAVLPHVTGSTGRASVTSPSSILLGTESELYDSVLQNFDIEMHTASKPTKNPSPAKPGPNVNKGLPQQMQLSSDMIPAHPKSSQQPDTHCAELKGVLSTQPTIK